tara:strand:+ start:6470 stop:6913 length:444 start_codon:yes stop_codon:yes gene_type:complete
MLNSNKYILIDKKKISRLFKNLKSTKRIILHKKNSPQQEMIIAQKKNYYYPVKKNTQSDQTFTILHGKLLILIFSKRGKLIKKILLSQNKNIICRIKKNIFHCDIAISKFSLHLETKSGVFKKNTNKFAKFKNLPMTISKELKKKRY